MKKDYLESGILRVRVVSEEDHVHLYSLLKELGYPEIEEWYGKKFYPNATNVYEIDIFKKKARSVPSITACAGMASTGVRFYSIGEFNRLAKTGFRIVPRYPLFHIPHDGWKFPEELMDSVCIPKDRFFRYHEKMRDRDIGRVVPVPYKTGFNVIRFEISRLLCDVERFIGQEEVMEQYGMGFCYEKAYDGTKIKDISEDVKEKTLRYYREHHEEVNRKCAGYSKVLFIDLHSYSDEIIPVDIVEPAQITPDVCIGIDPAYTPKKLLETVKDCFEAAGFTTAVNYPYGGCFVPDIIVDGECETDCVAIMIELNRRTYCDEKNNSVPEKTEKIRKIMQRIIEECIGI